MAFNFLGNLSAALDQAQNTLQDSGELEFFFYQRINNNSSSSIERGQGSAVNQSTMSKPIVKQLIIKFGRKKIVLRGHSFEIRLLRGLSWMWKMDGQNVRCLALSDRRISVAHRATCHSPTAWVLSLQEGCQLPRWCIAARGRHILWNGDNKPGLIHLTEWMFESDDCENALTLEFIMLGLSYFASLRLPFPGWSQPDMSNTSPNKLSALSSASLQFLHSLVKALASSLSEGCIHCLFPCCLLVYS